MTNSFLKGETITVIDPVSQQSKEFIINKKLGEGSFGIVYEGDEIEKGQRGKKPLAIKKYKRMSGQTQVTMLEEQKKFSEIQSTLGESYKTKVYPVGKEDVISVMPLLPGKCLDSLTEELKHLTFSQRLALAVLIAQTYAEFHAKRGRVHNYRDGLSHTDIKPENILIDIQWIEGKPCFQVHIIDFADVYARNGITLAPERFRGQKINKDIENALEQETYGMVFLLAPVLGGPANQSVDQTLDETKKILKKEGKKLGLETEVNKVADLFDTMSSVNPAIRPSDLAVVKVLNSVRIACIEKKENTFFAALKKGRALAFIQDHVKKLFLGKKAAEVSEMPEVNPENLTAFGMAVKLGQYDEAQRLLQQYATAGEKQAEVKQIDLNRRSLLHLAVLANRLDLAQLLLENGADVNQLDGDGRSPLHCAIAMRADDSLVQLLLEKGADFFQKNSYDCMPLQYAIINDCSLKSVNMILGKQEATLSDSDKIDLLCRAVLSGSVELIERFWIKELSAEAFFSLLNSVIKVEVEGVAAKCEAAKCVFKKIATIANIEAQNEEGSTVFHLAVLKGHKKLIELLLTGIKTNVTAENKQGRRPDINVIDKQSRTPLHLAIAVGQIDIAESLILMGNPNVDIQDSNGRTPLHLAVLGGHTKVVKWLKRKADINAIDKFGLTPLDYAIQGGSSNIEAILVSRHAKTGAELKSSVSAVDNKKQQNSAKALTISPMLSWFGGVIVEQPALEPEKALLESNAEFENPVPPAVPIETSCSGC